MLPPVTHVIILKRKSFKDILAQNTNKIVIQDLIKELLNMAMNTGEETDLDKIAEDELARLQRQVNNKSIS